MRVLVVTQTLDEYPQRRQQEAHQLLDTLESSGLKWQTQEQPLHRFAVIAGKLTWYGSTNLLGYWTKDDCTARIEDAQLASELLGSVR